MAAIANNNAFGAGACSWNLDFPNGNLTAAEILAYMPHWLKSVDVVDRFLCHGAKTTQIAAMINEFRVIPDNRTHMPNSTLVMMAWAMRRAGDREWRVSTHITKDAHVKRPENDLDVSGFRPPRKTHPKGVRKGDVSTLAQNRPVPPVDFKVLALHVKKHPSGDDALDLARCVQYAVQHPDEVWMFPTDFQRLVAHLGGPAPVTHSHFDRQAFARRNNAKFPSAKPTVSSAAPIKRKLAVEPHDSDAVTTTENSGFANTTMTRHTPSQQPKTARAGPSDAKGTRRSGRLANKNIKFADDSEADSLDNNTSGPPAKKRKPSHSRAAVKASQSDDDFVADETETSDDVPGDDLGDFDDVLPRDEAKRRMAVRRALTAGQTDSNEDYSERYDFASGQVPPHSSSLPRRTSRQSGFGRNTATQNSSFGRNHARHNSSFGHNDATQQPDFGQDFPLHQSNFGRGFPLQQSNFGLGFPPQQPNFEPRFRSQQPSFGQDFALQQPSFGQDFALQQPSFGQYFALQQPNFSQGFPLQQPNSDQDFASQQLNFDYGFAPQQLDFTHNQVPHQFDAQPRHVSQQPQMPSAAQLYGSPVPFPPPHMTADVSAEAMENAQVHQAMHRPLYLQPPALPRNRLRIDENNVMPWARPPYASIESMLVDAYDYMRFSGPNLIGPHRELHLLSDPWAHDVSDWAENIRWAKEQWTCHGSVWLENEHSLKLITAHRLQHGWTSLEADLDYIQNVAPFG